MAEWAYEAGIGENRAALIEDGAIVEAHVEADNNAPRVGTFAHARITTILVPGRRAIATLEDGAELLVEPLTPACTQGALLVVEVTREAIPEPGKAKRAKARISPDGEVERTGPDLAERVGTSGQALRTVRASDPDLLEAAGWSEVLEAAASGAVAFPGGALRINLTPAMTLIDVDGDLPPAALAMAGTTAAAKAIRLFGIGGSIGLDLPTVAGKAERLAIAESFDAVLPQPFERTAVNGFGFMQIVRPRPRASLCELLRYDAARSASRSLLRRAQRSGILGRSLLTAHPSMMAVLEAYPAWLTALAAQLGGEVTLRSDPRLAISGGHVSAQTP